MLCPARWPPTLGSGPACWRAPPRVPPGGMTTASLSWASCRNCRPFRGIVSTSRVSMTSLISAVVVWSRGALISTVTSSLIAPRARVNSSCRVRPTSSRMPVWVERWEAGQLRGDGPLAGGEAGEEEPPLGVGDPLDDGAARGMGGHDEGARQDRAALVRHHAQELGGVGLGGSGGRRGQHRQQGPAGPSPAIRSRLSSCSRARARRFASFLPLYEGRAERPPRPRAGRPPGASADATPAEGPISRQERSGGGAAGR